MIHSALAGKNSIGEDVFTSNCLGLLSLLGGPDVLSFFEIAKSLREKSLVIGDCQGAEITLNFWPCLPDGSIPDATITISSRAALRFKIIVEVKHGAGKSGSGDDDQLAKYWRAAESLYPGQCAVVYLTHDRAFPKRAIEESIDQAGSDAAIFWLSWCDLFQWVHEQLLLISSRLPVEKRILEALQDYLGAYGYRVFLGWDISIPRHAVPTYCRQYSTSSNEFLSPIYRRSYSSKINSTPNGQYVRAYDQWTIYALSIPYHQQK